MKIHLVRVCEHPGGSLYIDRKPQATTSDDYIAISHVWGTPDTVRKKEIDGVSWKVSLSPGKQDILLLLRRDDICGTGWFWMDLFCIDQTDSSSISIPDQLMAIPSIYKSSRCVKVLLESPVCEAWQQNAIQLFETQAINEENFHEDELAHGSSCPHLLFADPWFERLWTRQEGLYGCYLHFIVLEPVQCKKQSKDAKAEYAKAAWEMHGALLAHRFRAETFLLDKLAYHGFTPEKANESLFSLYFDVVYKRRVNITLAYDCEKGPHPSYNPIREAWRSQRSTTKPCDYVLAVFPDIDGYKAPEDARKLSFPELLLDAMKQPSVRAKLQFVPKVPQGVSGPSGKAIESMLPWLAAEPTNIGEAYDPFTADTIGTTSTGSEAEEVRIGLLPGEVQLQIVETTAPGLGTLIQDDWGRTVDTGRHVALLSPGGPCTGVTRQVATNDRSSVEGDIAIGSDEILLHLQFAEDFLGVAVSQYLSEQAMSALVPRTTGVLSTLDRTVKDRVSDTTFLRELKRFMVCLICGTSLRTADRVLEVADVVRVTTPYEPLLGVVHRATRLEPGRDEIVLICGARWDMEGFYIGVRNQGGVSVRGRTVIPNKRVWDSIERYMKTTQRQQCCPCS